MANRPRYQRSVTLQTNRINEVVGTPAKTGHRRGRLRHRIVPVLSSPIVAGLLISLSQTPIRAQTKGDPQQYSTVNNSPSTPPNGSSAEAALPPNGDFVVFQSSASNLVEGDTNNASDIFLRKISSNAVTRLSVTSAGEQAVSDSLDFPADSNYPAVSPILSDGTYGVAFTSRASNLATSDGFANPNRSSQVYLRIPALKKTVLISRGLNGAEAGNGESYSPSLTALEGPNRFLVAFSSNATNLLGSNSPQSLKNGEANRIEIPQPTTRLYVAEVTISKSKTVSVKIVDGTDGITSGSFFAPVISGNGRFIVCKSDTSDLTPGFQSNGFLQIIRFDLEKRLADLISRNPAGEPGNGNSIVPSISFNGDRIVFTTEADNLGIPARQGEPMFVLWRDSDDSLQLVNQNRFGSKGNGLYSQEYPFGPQGKISFDGRFAIWSDKADNLVEGDTNGVADIFLKDFEENTIRRINISSGQQLDAQSTFPVIGARKFSPGVDDFLTAFQSRASNVGINAPDPFFDASNIDRVFVIKLPFVQLPNAGPSIPSKTQPKPSLAAQTLEDKANIATQPGVEIAKRKDEIILTFIQFQLPKKKRLIEQFVLSARSVAGSLKVGKVGYDVQIDLVKGKKRKTVIRRLETRNRVTIRKLPPGTYVVKYRAIGRITAKKTIQTKFSPEARFVVKK